MIPANAEHPKAGELVAYAERTLEPAGVERVRAHLEGCDECRELARDLADYETLEPPEEAYEVGEEELRAGLGALRERLLDPEEQERLWGDVDDASEEPVATTPETSTLPFPSATSAARTVTPAWLLAAAAVAVAGWSWGLYRHLETSRLESDLRDLDSRLSVAQSALRQPRANVPVAVLLAADDPLRAPETPGIPLGQAGATLAIELMEPIRETYRAEVRSSDDVVVAVLEDLRSQAGRVTFYLPPGSLAPGDHFVYLFGAEDEEKGAVYELAILE